MTAPESTSAHVELNRRYWEEQASAWHGPLARGHWSRPVPTWGLWSIPESELRILPEELAELDIVELGCGTAYVSARLARAGARPVGVDISQAQLATARAMQREFELHFPLLLADAERLPLRDSTFDLAISEFGASLWCDPHRWLPEAARVLRPGGRLVFGRRSPLFALCARPDGQAGPELLRPQFGAPPQPADDHVEFAIGHGELLRLLRRCGFVVDDLIEIRAPWPADRDYPEVSAEWAHQWPSEEIWLAHLAG
ncbi:class I SAM-dependent methyltransferase [Kitasatospora sp. NPDC006697]|uniref:class I SAM-dependent methyltransferase n=1 Tax=Kitasatospora sp. NPDC006697 TaxID=3364020 RepID=UPI0036BFCD3E